MSSFWIWASVRTGALLLGTVLLSWLIAVPAAWLIERTRLPSARALAALFTLPYVLPSYLLAIAWITLASPQVGWINILYRSLGGGPGPLLNIYTLKGLIFVEASALFSIFFLAFRASLQKMDPALEEAARLAGLSPWGTLFKVTLPLLRGSLFQASAAVALAAFASFGVPAMLGAPARIFVLSTGIFQLVRQGSPEGFSEALRASGFMALVALGLLLLSRRLAGASARVELGQRIQRGAKLDLGKGSAPAAIALWLLWLCLTGIPLAALVLSSFQTDPSSLRPATLSLRAWSYVLFSLSDFHRSVKNSILTSLGAGTAILGIALVVSLWRWRHLRQSQSSWRDPSHYLEALASLLYSLPGTVLALLLLIVGAGSLGFRFTDTLFILGLGYTLKYLALGLTALLPATLLVHPSLVEAAQLSGAGLGQRLKRVWLPLLRPALAAAALLVILPCLSELTLSTLLSGPGTETVGVMLFQLQEYADRPSAAVVGVCLLATVVVLQLFLSLLEKRDVDQH